MGSGRGSTKTNENEKDRHYYRPSLLAGVVDVERTGMGHKLRAGTANASTGSDQPLAPTNRHATLTWRCSTRCPEQMARKQPRRRTAHCARWRQPHRSCRQELASRRVRLSGHRRRDPGKGRQSAEYGSAATGPKRCPGRSRLARRQTEPDLRQTRRQVVQMMHAALACQLPQPLAIGREQ